MRIMATEGYEDFKYLSGVTILGTEVTLPIEIKGSEVTVKVEITNPSIAVDVNNFPSEYPLPTSQISDLQQVTITDIVAGLVIPVNIENPSIDVNVQNVVEIKNQVDSETGNPIPLDIKIVSSGIVLDVNITNPDIDVNVQNFPTEYPLPDTQISDLKNVSIESIAAGVVFDVNITNAQINVNVVNEVPIKNVTDPDTGDPIPLDIKIVSAGIVLDVNITNTSINVEVNNFPSEYPLPSDQISDLQNVTIQNIAAGVVIPISIEEANATVNIQGDVNSTIAGIVAGVVIPIKIDSVEDGVVFDIHIASVEAGVVFDVNITNTSLTVVIDTSSGPVDVHIKSQETAIQITGDVNITNTSVNVNVLGGELDVNVGTFPFEKASENILENPGFETGDLTGWSGNKPSLLSVVTSPVYGGSYACKITPDGAATSLYPEKMFFCQPGQKVMFSGFVRREAGITIIQVRFPFYTSEGKLIQEPIFEITPDSADVWTSFRITAEAPDGAVYFRVAIVAYNTDSSSAVYVDSLYVPRMVLVGHSTEIPVNMNIASQSVDIEVVIKSSNVTLDVNITGSDVDIPVVINAQNVTLDVNIVGQDQDINVKITGQEVTLNVSIEGMASVSIDNATVYLNVQNEKITGTTVAFDNTANATTLIDTYDGYGIYLRNIRGGLLAIALKVKELSGTDQKLTICFAINPLAPPIYKKTVTIPANADGIVGTFYIFDLWWDYDTMFVYIESTNSNVQIYAESGVWGSYAYKKVANQFNSISYAIGIQIKTYGGSFKHIPVSGTVNTINIPNRTSGADSGSVTIDPDTTVTLIEIEGMGKTQFIELCTSDNDDVFRIYIDDKLVWGYSVYFLAEVRNYQNSTFGVRVIRYDTSNNQYVIVLEIPFEFRKSLKITAYAQSYASSHTVSAYVIYSKIC